VEGVESVESMESRYIRVKYLKAKRFCGLHTLLAVDEILAVAFVLDLSVYGDWPDKDLVGHAMRTPAKAVPVKLAVALT
jgi:hypothetical protein